MAFLFARRSAICLLTLGLSATGSAAGFNDNGDKSTAPGDIDVKVSTFDGGGMRGWIMEFTPAGSPHMRCVAHRIGGTGSMDCFPALAAPGDNAD